MSYQRFTNDNAAVLLIDHQIGTMSWCKSMSFDELKSNTLMLAKAVHILGMPVVLTSSMEEYAQGPLLPELKELFPSEFEARIKRLGIVNAMDDTNFEKAVIATGRKKIILAGVTNDVCTVYPAISLINDGYDVQVVADAGASPTKFSDDISLRRMEQNGVTLTSTNQVIAELTGDWTTEAGTRIVQEVLLPALQG